MRLDNFGRSLILVLFPRRERTSKSMVTGGSRENEIEGIEVVDGVGI